MTDTLPYLILDGANRHTGLHDCGWEAHTTGILSSTSQHHRPQLIDAIFRSKAEPEQGIRPSRDAKGLWS